MWGGVPKNEIFDLSGDSVRFVGFETSRPAILCNTFGTEYRRNNTLGNTARVRQATTRTVVVDLAYEDEIAEGRYTGMECVLSGTQPMLGNWIKEPQRLPCAK